MLSSEMPPHTRPLTFPLLLRLKHYTHEHSRGFSILSILSCPALKTLAIEQEGATLCTVAQYPAIQELCLVTWYLEVDSPLLRDSKQLETLIISLPNTGLAMQTHNYMRKTLDIYPGSLRRFRLYLTLYSRFDSVDTFKSGLRDVAKYFASRGRDIDFELIRGQDQYFF